MGLAIPRRRTRSRLLHCAFFLFGIWCFLDVLRVQTQLVSNNKRQGSSMPKQRIFIASTHWNNEAILRTHWNDAVVDLVQHFGKDNVYVSVYESGSWDNTKGALQELEQRLAELGARRSIILDPVTHEDEIAKSADWTGWILTARKKTELRRIPYLADLRNRSLQPLLELQQLGQTFDKILFLNDVVFTVRFQISLEVFRS